MKAVECLELPNEVNRRFTAILSWLLIFILCLQAKYYIPDTAMQCLIRFLYALHLLHPVHARDLINQLAKKLISSLAIPPET